MAEDSPDVPETEAEPNAVRPQRHRTDTILGALRRIGARWRAVLLALALILAVGFVAGYYCLQYRPDQQTGRAAAQEVVRAASDGAVAILSYSPDTLSRDFGDAKSRLTGDFLDYYGRFTEQIVAPTAQRGEVTTTAKVVRAATVDVHPGSATVLAFVNQRTTGKASPKPVETGASILISLLKVNGTWLISKFDPV